MLFDIASIYKLEQPNRLIILVQEHTSVQIGEILVGLKQAPKQ